METLVISLGGSIIAPDKPDYFFIREFKNFVLRYMNKYRFIIVCGGGKTNSYYNRAATRVSKVKDEDLDWLGIMATRLNAELTRIIFGDLAYKKVIINPEKKITTKKPIIVAAGYKPGWSTDYVSVLLAKQFKVKRLLNFTNIDYVYDKDPSKHSDAKRIYEINWTKYKKLIGKKWSPRMNAPFGPIASKEAKKLKLTVAVLNGTNLKNVESYLLDRSFKGTVIKP